MQNKQRIIKEAFLASLPVMFGYIPLGIGFGVLMQQAGYGAAWSGLASIIVFAGSAQYMLVSFLSSGASLAVIGIMTFLINSRHMFYGLSFIERFRKMGKKYPYMVFSLSDETYSILCSMPNNTGEEEKAQNLQMFLVALMDQCYWVLGSVIGGLLGSVIPFDTTGLDFCMTAMFVVLFIEKWLECRSHLPAIVGAVSATVCLIILGPNNFILPSLIITVGILMGLRKPIEKKLEEGES